MASYSARHPVWLPVAPKPTAMAFAVLFAIESMARSLVATVVSVQAYDLVQSTQQVSLLFAAVGVASLIGTLLIPYLVGWTARRYVYTLGAGCLVAGAAAMAMFSVESHAIGMIMRVLGVTCLNITTSLYILDHIRRHELVRSEPLRLSMSTASWTIGPFLGIWLYTQWGPWAPQGASVACTLVLLGLFWYLRLSDSPAIQAAKLKPAGPLANIRRFAGQPRLRLAWLVAFGRSCFWVTFFIYAPLLLIRAGYGPEAGGILVSAGNAVLAGAVLFGKLSERIGVRWVISGAFASMGIASVGAGLAGLDMPIVAALLLFAAAVGATAVDGIGSLPFLRAVHHHERAQMTAVYRTYVDSSELIPTAIFSIVLLFLPVPAVFVVLGAWAIVCAWITWVYLPKSM
jgi:MFS family permease